MKKQVLLNVVAQAIGKALTAITSFVIVKIITSIGTETYGAYVTAYEYLAFFGIIADAGLYTIAVRDMSKHPERSSHIMSNLLSMRLILIFVITLIAGGVAQFITAYPAEVQAGVWITGLSMALTIIAGTVSAVLQARMKIYWFTLSLVIGKIILAAGIFWLSLNPEILQDKLAPLLWMGVFSNIVFCILTLIFAGRELPLRFGFDWHWWKHVFKTTLPYGMALILQTLYLRVDILFISILLGMRETGLYGGATRILETFMVLGVFFGQAFLPSLAKQETDAKKLGKSVSWGIMMLLFIALPVIIGITAFSEEIIRFIATDDLLTNPTQTGSNSVLRILIPTIAFAYINQLLTMTLVSRNRQNYLLKVNALALGANAVLNFTFLHTYGIQAAAWSTVACEIFVFTLLWKEIRHHFKGHFEWQNMPILILANGTLALIIYATPLRENLILATLVGGATYAAILAIFRNKLLEKEVLGKN